jgi:hypothetical protein
VAAQCQLPDPMQVLLDGASVIPAYAGAAGQSPGMDGVQILTGTSVRT